VRSGRDIGKTSQGPYQWKSPGGERRLQAYSGGQSKPGQIEKEDTRKKRGKWSGAGPILEEMNSGVHRGETPGWRDRFGCWDGSGKRHAVG